MRILILGANGQLGKELSLVLSSCFEIFDFTRSELDLKDSVAIQSILKNKNIDMVLNAAAYTKVDLAESQSEQAFLINSESLKNLAIACKKENCFLIHFSTDYVFSGEGNSAWKEHDRCSPCNIYGRSKLAGEIEIQKSMDAYLIFRISWVYGEYGSNFPKTILNAAKTKETLKVIDDQIGTPTWTKFIAVQILRILEKFDLKDLRKKSGIYHMVSKEYCSWYELTKFILENYKKLNPNNHNIITKDVIPIPTEEYPLPAKRPKNSRLDCNKFEENFFPIKSSWKDGIKYFLKTLK